MSIFFRDSHKRSKEKNSESNRPSVFIFLHKKREYMGILDRIFGRSSKSELKKEPESKKVDAQSYPGKYCALCRKEITRDTSPHNLTPYVRAGDLAGISSGAFSMLLKAGSKCPKCGVVVCRGCQPMKAEPIDKWPNYPKCPKCDTEMKILYWWRNFRSFFSQL